mmetsp:Transcript_21981/g.62439  ORF Transcript_21981/g.62439 Transcript_21981/m.62439 type:complete len:363 (-) Transcript_21981:330-1418(-)
MLPNSLIFSCSCPVAIVLPTSSVMSSATMLRTVPCFFSMSSRSNKPSKVPTMSRTTLLTTSRMTISSTLCFGITFMACCTMPTSKLWCASMAPSSLSGAYATASYFVADHTDLACAPLNTAVSDVHGRVEAVCGGWPAIALWMSSFTRSSLTKGAVCSSKATRSAFSQMRSERCSCRAVAKRSSLTTPGSSRDLLWSSASAACNRASVDDLCSSSAESNLASLTRSACISASAALMPCSFTMSVFCSAIASFNASGVIESRWRPMAASRRSSVTSVLRASSMALRNSSNAFACLSMCCWMAPFFSICSATCCCTIASMPSFVMPKFDKAASTRASSSSSVSLASSIEATRAAPVAELSSPTE